MPAQPPRRVGRVRRSVLIVGLVGLAGGTTGILGLVNQTDPPRRETTPTTTTSLSTTTTETASLDELQGDARRLAELLAEGRATTYHARYAGASVGQTEGAIRLESWAKGGEFRQDVAFAVGGVAVERRTFVLRDRGVTCQRSGEESWVCNDVPLSQMQGADPLTGGTLAQLKKAAVGERPGEVGEHEARCFTVSYDAQTTEMCVSPSGVPLQIRTQESTLVVELLEPFVATGVFVPPAPSSGKGTTTTP